MTRLGSPYTNTLMRFRDFFARSGFDPVVRQAEIDALPTKTWNQWPVFRILCHGQRGRGPHWMWVNEAILWSLISFDCFVCPYHVPDLPLKVTEPRDQ